MTKNKHTICLFFCILNIFFTLPAAHAQQSDKQLFEKFEKHFTILDSLIFDVNKQETTATNNTETVKNISSIKGKKADSLINIKVEKQIRAMKAETGLLISGQSYYRLDKGIGADEDDALSRYTAKAQVELRWNFLSSSLINRKSRIGELNTKGDIERVTLERERTAELIKKQKEYFRSEYDSLLSGILQFRVMNLQLLNEAQLYLVSDRSIGTDELLKIMDEQAIAERTLIAIPRNYPQASQLTRPQGEVIRIDTVGLMKQIFEKNPELHLLTLEAELLLYKEKNTDYLQTLNISPFLRYSHYVRPEARNSNNIDAGIAFQIPLSAQEPRKRAAIKAERLQKTLEKEERKKLIAESVNILLQEIDRANRGLSGELSRIDKMKSYIKLRKQNYQRHIGEYNFMSRIKEYNHYLTCWENYYSYKYKRDCYIAELQNYLCGQSILDFCTIIE